MIAGLAILVLAVAGASGMAAALIMTWSKHVERIVTELAAQKGELPPLALTGERELDNIVRALNDAGQRLSAPFRETTEKLAGQVASPNGLQLSAASPPVSPTRSAIRSRPCVWRRSWRSSGRIAGSKRFAWLSHRSTA